MWIVRLALRRPYTFVVMSILILIMGGLAIVRTPTDIFPTIDIPVVSIIWNYNGLVPQDMADRIVTITERNLTTTVDNIEHIESQSLYGIAVVKVFLQPSASLQQGIAQITAVSQTQLRQLPAGTTPPLIIAYSASSVPVLQLALSGPGLSEAQLNDYGLNFIRTQIITVPGTSVPYPYGGKQRQVQVDLNTTALQSKGLSPLDVVNAISVQNLILPTGTSKIGSKEYDVSILNAAPQTIADLNRIPIKTIGGTTIYIKDVAWVRDGFPPQTNIVRVNGQRSVLLTIQKAGNASTLNVISGIKALLPQIEATLPPQLQISPLADQSIFVRGAISGVVRETLIAACLTAFMILTFLGSWRSTVIIATSIPLAILTSIIVLSAIGQTINIMTLGGLALAVGILVDDATVEVENINRNRAKTWMKLFWIAHRKLRHPLSSLRSRSALCSRPCSCYPAWRDTCLCRLPKRWSLRCWPRISCRGLSSRLWRSICCKPRKGTSGTHRVVTLWCASKRNLKRRLRSFVTAFAACWICAFSTGLSFWLHSSCFVSALLWC
jgi:multidrug efflux pump subunit AcrB